MKVTNDLGLPLPLVRAVENDPYDNKGTMSVTTLLKPPQAYALTRKHAGELVEDAADRIWSLVGQVGHTILERAAMTGEGMEGYIAERRFYAEIDGEKVSGQVDLIDTAAETVIDFKFTSGWAVASAQKEGKSDWQMQLSMLALLARLEGVPVTKGKITAIIRDWTPKAALRNRDWEDKAVAVIDVGILSHDDTMDWMVNRVREFRAALAGDIRPCTPEERWHSPGKWAVYKGTNQKAAKLEDTEDALSAWIFSNRAKLGANYRIEQRPCEDRRCEKYCAAAAFCPQYQSNKAVDVGVE